MPQPFQVLFSQAARFIFEPSTNPAMRNAGRDALSVNLSDEFIAWRARKRADLPACTFTTQRNGLHSLIAQNIQ
jgi:hypothetical protein